ncbi:proteinase [Acrocarpospora phusangensis]|uniref:Proteinase n=1 Tax=Acrocarpospora phusangensis TaxID=1070424 RepID=A0A919QEH0_9ACTN|nr:alpha/beta hydrolase [Acrocarpospora phusangensis]GIH26451.1 proteinase [Acrocarpospora phusangensis]
MGRAAPRLMMTLAAGLFASALVLPGQTALADVPPNFRDTAPTGDGGDQPAEPRGEMPAAPAGLEGYYSQQLFWSDCRDGFECAKLTVPLDYTKPEGDQIKISVIRTPASGQKIGSLLMNPGGPGGSGVQMARGIAAVLKARLGKRFDLVGFDPRGVGESAPVNCFTDKERDAEFAMDTSPETKAEIRLIETAAQRFVDACEERSGKLLGHVGTLNAARDMDVLRAALGDPKLTYLGISYGTYLGTVYAHLFPHNVRALALDAAMDPAKSQEEQNAGQSQGFNDAYVSFLKDCFKQKDCPFKGRGTKSDIDRAVRKTNAMFEKVDKKPFPNRIDDRKVTFSLAHTGWFSALYSKFEWPGLRLSLSLAFKGDGTGLLIYADHYYERRKDGTYSNQDPAFRAINCLDNPRPKRNKFDACSLWPAKATPVPRSMRAKGAPPILVVGTLRDPATPYREAVALANHLSSGVLLTNDADGHGGYISSFCVTDIVDKYLITLETPRNGFRCAKEAQV